MRVLVCVSEPFDFCTFDLDSEIKEVFATGLVSVLPLELGLQSSLV